MVQTILKGLVQFNVVLSIVSLSTSGQSRRARVVGPEASGQRRRISSDNDLSLWNNLCRPLFHFFSLVLQVFLLQYRHSNPCKASVGKSTNRWSMSHGYYPDFLLFFPRVSFLQRVFSDLRSNRTSMVNGCSALLLSFFAFLTCNFCSLLA